MKRLGHVRSGNRWWAGGLLGLSWLLSGLPASAAMEEAEVKAAIVYNLLQFLEWPDAPVGNAFVLCLRPASELIGPMQKLSGQPVRGAVLEVRPLAPGDARGCQVAYADGTEAERAQLARRFRSEAMTLVIADRAVVMDESTAIQLRWVDNKIAFDVNMAAVRRAGAQVSSKILRLAKVVRE